ncbi:RND transporter [Veronia pacifica]|uniref:RND transporter n=2 Tax=Veronia pacifica TaxID=1080227 RepID=A0A1C3ERW2_9GAMM|nr:RND transporter [Veronia pacifica]
MRNMLFKWPVHYPWIFLIGIMTLVAVSSYGAKNLYFRGSYKVFFHDDSPEILSLDKIQNRFAVNQGISIALENKNGDIFNQSTLRIIRELTERGWQLPYAVRSSSIANFQYTSADGDDLKVEPLISMDNPLGKEEIAFIKQTAMSDPNLRGGFISPEGDVALTTFTVKLPEDGNLTQQTQTIISHVDALIAEFQKEDPTLVFHKVGTVAFNAAFIDAAIHDVKFLIPLMFSVVIIFLGFLLKSWRFVFATMMVLTGSVCISMGLLGWAGHFLSNMTIGLPMLLLTLAVADCVHIITGYVNGLNQGKNQREAISYSLELNFTALLVTSVTTSFGFLMMNASVSPVLVDFGNLSALGVMVAFLLSITLLPALLAILPVKVNRSESGKQDQVMLGLSSWVIRHHKKILPISAIVVLGGGFLMSKNQLNDEMIKYFKPGSEFRETVDFLDERVGNSTVSIILESGEQQGVTQVRFLKKLDELTTWLDQQPEVNFVYSLSDVVKRLNQNLNGDESASYRLPENDQLAAQYLLLYELSLPYGLDLNSRTDIDKSAVRVSVIMKSLGSAEMQDFEKRVEDWLDARAPEYRYQISDLSVLLAHIGESNLASMLVTLPIAIIVISSLLVLALRSWRLGILSLIPNCAPIIVGFGVWFLVYGEVNLAVSVVISMTLGIVVDDTVHFLSKYQLARKEGKTVEEGIQYAFVTVGKALWVTTVVLGSGFAILAFSDFIPNASLGTLSTAVVLFALLGDFFMLPALLMLIDRKPYKRAEEQLIEQRT